MLNKKSAYLSKILITVLLSASTLQEYTPVSVVQLIRPGASHISPKIIKHETFKIDEEDEGHNHETLESNGVRMMYLLGAEMRERYKDIIGTPDQHRVKVVSAHLDKSIQSSYSYLMGLFPPGTGRKFDTSKTYHMIEPPVPNFIASFKNESVLPQQITSYPIDILGSYRDNYFYTHTEYSCPGYYKRALTRMQHEYAEDMHHIEEKIHEMGFDHLYDGQTKAEINEAFLFLEAMLHVRGQLPTNVTQELYTELRTFYSYLKSGIDFHEKEERGIFTSKISEKVIQYFEGAMSSDEFNPKFTLYTGTGHELFAFLDSLGLTSEECLKKSVKDHKFTAENPLCELYPAQGSSLTFELSYNNPKSNYYVRVMYNGKAFKVCESEETDHYCTMSNFLEVVKKKLINFEIIKNLCTEYKELRTELKHVQEEVGLYKWGTVIGLIIFALAFLCLILECCFRTRDKEMIERTLERYKQRAESGDSLPGSTGSLENA